MSTKIYNGVKFKAKSLSEIIKQLHGVSEDAIKNTIGLFQNQSENFFGLLCYLVIEYKQKTGKDVTSPFELGLVLKNNLEKDPFKDDDIVIPLLFNITIFENKGTFYGIYFDKSNINYNLLFDKGIVEDFHYQNQSDKPENISDDEWESREKIWEEIFDDISPSWVPSEAGVTYDIIKPDSFLLGFPREFVDEIKEYTNKLMEELNSSK